MFNPGLWIELIFCGGSRPGCDTSPVRTISLCAVALLAIGALAYAQPTSSSPDPQAGADGKALEALGITTNQTVRVH